MGTALHIVGLGCARNDVDAEELAARFAGAGFDLVDEPERAAVVVVNTCGFIEAAKAESIDEILSAAQLKADGTVRTVIATGCLAERYGADLAASLPEADAVIGFDGYDAIADTVRQVMAGRTVTAHRPVDRRRALPLAPAQRQPAGEGKMPAWLPAQRHRLGDSPMAPLKIASGCDRRCAFCAIPSFRGALVSRPVADITREAAWLASQGVKELFLVSENTTSYGKDLDRADTLELLLAKLSAIDGIEWIRLSYLQPAEVRPSLVDAIAATPKVVPYFDLPFQHAAGPLLRRMRRFGDAESFLDLLATVRRAVPAAGIRSNVIVGFPGETEADVDTLRQFLGDAGLDAVGVFPYSDEDGTEAATLDGHLDADEIRDRTADVVALADTLMAVRAEERIGEVVSVLIESGDDAADAGRAGQQGPEDGRTTVARAGSARRRPGDIVTGTITATDGVDWLVSPQSELNGGAVSRRHAPGQGCDRMQVERK